MQAHWVPRCPLDPTVTVLLAWSSHCPIQECCSSWPLMTIWLPSSFTSLPREAFSNHPVEYRIPHPHAIICGYMFHYWLSLKKKKSWFPAFVNVCAVNTSAMAKTKLPTWYHWSLTWEDMHTLGSYMHIPLAAAHHAFSSPFLFPRLILPYSYLYSPDILHICLFIYLWSVFPSTHTHINSRKAGILFCSPIYLQNLDLSLA